MEDEDTLRCTPIPGRAHSRLALDGEVTFDLNDPRSLEPLVDLSGVGVASDAVYARDDGSNAPYHRRLPGSLEQVLVRRSVAARLASADALLRPYGVRLLVLDGFRPLELQLALWDFFLDLARRDRPDASAEQVRLVAQRYCFDPTLFDEGDWRTWPNHLTGGAVDVTLQDAATNKPVEMGGAFDELSERSHSDFLERRRQASANKLARRLLYNAMTMVGFTNYWPEWWHYDFGNSLWALSQPSGRPSVKPFYGLPPDLAFAGKAVTV